MKGTRETLAGKGARAGNLHPGACQNLPRSPKTHVPKTHVSHKAQYSGRSFPEKPYISKFTPAPKHGPGFQAVWSKTHQAQSPEGCGQK